MQMQSWRFMRLPEVQHQIGLGRSAIYQKIKAGEFPCPYSLGARAVAWNSEDIEAWMESRLSAGAK
jgi:prophage regulatory protein